MDMPKNNSLPAKMIMVIYVLASAIFIFVDKGIPAITGKNLGHTMETQMEINSKDIQTLKDEVKQMRGDVGSLLQGQSARNEAILALRGDIASLKDSIESFQKLLIAHISREK